MEILIAKKINDDPTLHKPTRTWVESTSLEIREKLAKFGLCIVSSKHTVKELWDEFLDKYEIRTYSTWKTYIHSRRLFELFFKRPNELIVKLTKERIEEWKAFLLADGRFGQPTVAGAIRRTKTVFNWAKKQK